MAAAAKTKKDGDIYAFLGSDESEVKRAAGELAARLSPGGDFGTDVVDGCAAHAEDAANRIHQAIEALLTFPMFGGEKLVWLKNANFLADTATGKAEAVQEALGKLTETLERGLPPGIRFILSAGEADKRRTFYKALGRLAKVEVYDKLDTSKSGWEDEAALLIRQSAERSSLSFTSEGLDSFTFSTGGDRRVIEGELEKLDIYLGTERRKVTAEDVRLLVPLTRTGIIWELGNALSERDLRRALDLLDQLLFQGESAIGIFIVAIMPTVRNLLVVKDLMQRHKLARPQQPFFFGKTLERLPPEATAHLPRKKDGGVNAYALGIAASHAHRFSLPELVEALESCLVANVRLVTSSLDPRTALTELLVKIAGQAKAAAKPRRAAAV